MHHDILEGRFHAAPFATPAASRTAVAGDAAVASGATIEGPAFIDAGVTIEDGARVGPRTVVGRGCRMGPGSVVDGLDPLARLRGRRRRQRSRRGARATACRIGRSVSVGAGAVLGDHTSLTDFTRV